MSLYEYYARQSLLPTEGEVNFPAHELERRRLFTDLLALPSAVFRDARLLEFGPDTGANAVVFASWGARLTLAEPNTNAHPRLRETFRDVGLDGRFEELSAIDVKSFPAERGLFDIVDAEGFTYTLPLEVWLEKFSELVADEGFAIVSYYATPGSFFELLWKVAYTRFREVTGLEATATAEALFATKWASIPHRRSIASWAMDVLENPFVRLQYFIEPRNLLERADAAGFVLHSSWPQYRDPFDVGWHRKLRDRREDLERNKRFVEMSALSYLMGRGHPTFDDHSSLVESLVEAADLLIDRFDPDMAHECRRLLDSVGDTIVSGSADDVALSRRDLFSARRLLELLSDGDVAALETFCSSDLGFIESWGAPCHFAVLLRRAV